MSISFSQQGRWKKYTLVPEVFLDFSSFREAANTSREAANTSREAARKKNFWLPWT